MSRVPNEWEISWLPIHIIDTGEMVIKLVGDTDEMSDTGRDT
jgi:hypothetical protein